MDNVRRMDKATKRRERDEEIKKAKAHRTKAQSSMTRTSSDLAGLLISIDEIVRREESGQSKDFEEGKWCSIHATATCEQSRPKQGERKDQPRDTYKWHPCRWKQELSLADSYGAELTSMMSQSILPVVRGSIPHWCANKTGSHTLQMPTKLFIYFQTEIFLIFNWKCFIGSE